MLSFKKYLLPSLAIFLFAIIVFCEPAFAVTFTFDKAIGACVSFVLFFFLKCLPYLLIIGGIGGLLLRYPENKLFYLSVTIAGVLLYFVL